MFHPPGRATRFRLALTGLLFTCSQPVDPPASPLPSPPPGAAPLRAQLTAQDSPAITRGPYLQMGGHDEVTIRWRTDQPLPGRVTAWPVAPGPPPAPLVVDEPGPAR